MAQSGATPILLYGSVTPGAEPQASNLETSSTRGVEIAVNAADGVIYYKDTNGVVQGIGGVQIAEDSTTETEIYPLFSNRTSGLARRIYVDDPKYTYVPKTGVLTSPVHSASNGLFINSQTVNTSYTVPLGYSATSSGPVTEASGVSVTLSAGSRWVIL